MKGGRGRREEEGGRKEDKENLSEGSNIGSCGMAIVILVAVVW